MPTSIRRGFPVLIAMVALNLVPYSGAQDAKSDPSVERMRRDIFFLASDECEGRGVGTLGLDLAAQYIAVQFSRAGLKPGGVNGTYFQPFPFCRNTQLDGTSTLVLEGPEGKKLELKQGTDFQVSGTSAPGKRNAPVVFVGYGVSANGIAYDDFAGVDVKGKIVIALRRVPRWNDNTRPFGGMYKNALAALEAKQNAGEGHGAVAVIVVNDASETKDTLMPFQFSFRITTTSTPFVHMKRSFLEEMMKSSLGKSLQEIEKAIDGDLKPRSAALTGWSANLDVKVKRSEVPVKNVIGYIDGEGPLATETVVVGSHYDHLGYGAMGGAIGGKAKTKTTYYGADDNGSGTTTMMELARRFADKKDRTGRRMVFMAFTAEEMGLIGSRHYTEIAPLFPLKNTAAMFNLDMVGKLDWRITAIDEKEVSVSFHEGKLVKTYPLTAKCKFFRSVKGTPEELKDGAKAEVFKKIPAGGLHAMITWDFKGLVYQVTVFDAQPLLVEGTNTAKEFDELVTRLNPGFDIIKKNTRGFIASDQYNFYQQRIPVVFFWTGEHPDYHRSTDLPDRINVHGMKRIADYAELVINDFRTNPKRPEYTPIGAPKTGVGGPPTLGPSLRFRPEELFEGKGVLIRMIIVGGPADKAGMKEGDIIIELAGKQVPNVTVYNAIRATLKAGVEVTVRVLRDKKEITLKITPVNLEK
ncbi:MAG: M20/M25/M40 family metallo-hydrolase [Planctomycetes bacterium]|nr:M20/M25/M40 family metallo-hydrolase [Planctomycetota bacterium]